jgi:hypothetical protein
VLAAEYAMASSPEAAQEQALLPRAVRWRTLPRADDDVLTLVHAALAEHPSRELDAVLRAVADEQLDDVIVVPPQGAWLYHPYDGGADVIAESPQARDALRQRFAGWLSGHPHGL